MTDTLGLRRQRCLVCRAGNRWPQGTRTGEGHTADAPTCPSEGKGSEIRELPASRKAFVDRVQKLKQQVLGCWFTSYPSPFAVILCLGDCHQAPLSHGRNRKLWVRALNSPPPEKKILNLSLNLLGITGLSSKFLAIVTALWILILHCPVVRSLAWISYTLQTQLFIMSV